MVAMPSAAPIILTVVFAPLVAPARSAGTSDRITLFNCEPANPMPVPKSAKPGSNDQNVSEGDTANAIAPRPVAWMTSPERTTLVVPIRRVNQLPTCEPITMNTPDGTSHNPVSTAERCRPSCNTTDMMKRNAT